MTPDGTSIIGATRFKSLSMNTGHGTLGRTMAFRSGKVLADLLTGQRPQIATDDLSLERYASSAGGSARLAAA